MKSPLFIAGLMFLTIIPLADFKSQNYKKIKSGDYSLSCVFQDGERVIDPEMVIDEANGEWKFKNGRASNCKITPK